MTDFNVRNKSLTAKNLHQGLSEPEFCGDLLNSQIIIRFKRIGYNLNVMRQSACLVFNPFTADNNASQIICTPMGRASISMLFPT